MPVEARERVIAEIARSLGDLYLLIPSPLQMECSSKLAAAFSCLMRAIRRLPPGQQTVLRLDQQKC